MRSLLNLLRRQDGIAMPTVMGSMALTTVLATTTLAVALDGNQTSSADRDSKRAAAAAQAGLDLALLHLQQAGTNDDEPCVQGPSPDPLGPDGQCAEHEVPVGDDLNLGNGVRVRYLVGAPGAEGCRTLPDDNPDRDMTQDRCITATGIVNGVWRRAQSRVTYEPPTMGFFQAGLVGERLVDIGNNAQIYSPVGSNVRVNGGANSRFSNPLHLKPGATTDLHHNITPRPAVLAKDPPWALRELDWSLARSKKAQTDTALAAIPGWNRLTRTLTLSNRQTVNLSGGDYHVCNVFAPNNNAITVTNGEIVRLWVDSSRGNTPGPDGVLNTADDGGAGCPANSGRFTMGNNGTVNASDDRNPAEFELYLYGSRANASNTGDPDLDIMNGGSFYWTIWAPKSDVAIKNDNNGNAPQGEVVGAISARSITLGNNGTFRHDPRIHDKELPTTSSSERRGWSECTSRPTVEGDPQSGCS